MLQYRLLFFFILVESLFCTSCCAENTEKWKIGNKIINSATFELHAGQSAIYAGNINGGSFNNFVCKAHVTHSEGAKARLWFHSDSKLSNGYSYNAPKICTAG